MSQQFKLLGFFLLVRARRYFQIDADSLLAVDRRPPILFLRSFEDDEKQKYGRSDKALLDFSLETRLSNHFSRFGPFVAIGSPTEKVPQPGAARVLLSDDEWQPRVLSWMRDARLIIMYSGKTHWVNWELRQVVENERATRLILMIPEIKAWRSSKRDREISARVQQVREVFKGTPWEEELLCFNDFAGLRAMLFRPDGSMVIVKSRSRSRDSYHLAALVAHQILIEPQPLEQHLDKREPQLLGQGSPSLPGKGSKWGAVLVWFFVIVGVMLVVGAVASGIKSLATGLRSAVIGLLIALCAFPLRKSGKPRGDGDTIGVVGLKKTAALHGPAILLAVLVLFNIGGVVRDEFRHDILGYWHSWLIQPTLPLVLILFAAVSLIAGFLPLHERRQRWFACGSFFLLVAGFFVGIPSLLDIAIPGGASLRAARALYNEQQYAQALPNFKRAATAGNAEAMYVLGLLCQNGQGVTQNYEQARQWYEKAAAVGYGAAMLNLGVLYQNGQGVAQDYEQARQWYEKAAAAGDGTAMCNLGVLYENGQGVTQDYEQARQWYEKAIAAGEGIPMNNLGRLYYDGHGVVQDYEQARQWWEKAAAAGNGAAMYNLGLLYYDGRGVAQDYEQARQWWEKAAAAGDASAAERLQSLPR